jgi:hypothetical protein
MRSRSRNAAFRLPVDRAPGPLRLGGIHPRSFGRWFGRNVSEPPSLP